MYRNCIFCSGELGRNESIEEFPVGERLAFDAAKGRLWAVCGKCRRWNLAPIEERWEAVETAEKRFRDSRLRVHSENIGLAKMAEGTTLIRVGAALPNEFAGWRYGSELLRRRRRALIWGGVATVGGAAALGAGTVLTMGVMAAYIPLYSLMVSNVGAVLAVTRHERRVVGRVEKDGGERLVRMQDMFGSRIVTGAGGGLAVEVPDPSPHVRIEEAGVVRWVPPAPIRIEGEDAARVLARSIVHANRSGASRGQLEGALDRLASGKTVESYLRSIGARAGSLFEAPPNQPQSFDIAGSWRRFVGTFRGERIAGRRLLATRLLPPEDRIALEMALHEDTERRALEEDLALYQQAWREAEEIAAIADTLPDDPLEEMRKER